MPNSVVKAYVYDVSCPEVVEFWSSTLYTTSSPRPTGVPIKTINCTAKPGYCYGSGIIPYGSYILWLRNAGCWASPAIAEIDSSQEVLSLSPSKAIPGVDDQLHAFDGMSIEDVIAYRNSTLESSGRYLLTVQWVEERNGEECEVHVEGGYIVETDEGGCCST